VLLRLWLPIVFFWWSYAWSGKVLHVYHPPDFSYDRPILAAEEKLGQPSLWLARGRPRWLNEAMSFFYFSYYFYTPVLAVVLYGAGRLRDFEALALAVNLGYAICYSTYPFTPVQGPRWALVDEGLLPRDERVLEGYGFTRIMNAIIWGDLPHKGGAMPSAHSSTAIIFLIWCGRIWGGTGLAVGIAIAGAMFVSTVYGRYHYVVDVLAGLVIGLACLGVADLIVLTP
jgi:membrane-associated phospholipid phosphatase